MKISVILIIVVMITFSGCVCFHEIKKVPMIKHKFPVDENSITYIGHATILIHLDNLNFITDPMLSDYIGWFAKRCVEPGIKFENLPSIDAILISHEHNDHLDKSTLKRFSKDIPVIISKGLGKRIKKLGFSDVRELNWWKSTWINDTVITAVPAKHIFSKSSGFIIKHHNKAVYFAGDTGLFDGFREIRQKFKIDVAVLPIGDYHPRLWFIPGFTKITRARHMAPGDIPDAITMLQPKIVIPIHWGTFKISGTDLNEPATWLKKVIKERQLEEKVFILNHGESKTF